MPKKLVGHLTCPECDFADAEIAEDKNGHLYRYCPDCNATYFTRGDPKRTANIKKKMRPLAPATPATPTAPAGDPPPKKKGALEAWYEGAKK